MKRFFIFFFVFLCSISSIVNAQEAFSEFLSVPFGDSISVDAGRPVVFVPPKKTDAEEFKPQPVTWQPDVEQVQITSFAGQILQVPNLTHIPSFFVYVQVLSDKSVIVTERISLVLSKQQMTPFVRAYPLALKDVNEKNVVQDVKFLWSRYNSEAISPLWKSSLNEVQFSFFDDIGLTSGVHSFELSYLIPNAVRVEGNTSRLFLPILGTKLPYLTENLQILVTYPEKTHLSSAKAFFGQNNQVVENAYSVYQNEKDHLVYKIKGVVPAFADVHLEILADGAGFGSASVSEKFDDGVLNNNALIFAVFVAVLLFLYFHFTAWDLKDKSIESAYLAKVRSLINYDIATLRWLTLKKADIKTLLASVLYLFLKKDIDIRLNAQNQIILLQSKTQKQTDESIVKFLMSKHLRRNVAKLSISEGKIKHFAQAQLRCQMLKIVRRELFIGFILTVLSIFVVFYLNSSLTKIIVAIILIVSGFTVSIVHFIRKGDFYSLLRASFMNYAQLPRQEDKRVPFDIALDKQTNKDLKIKIEDKEFLIKDFEQMFLTQLKLTGTKK